MSRLDVILNGYLLDAYSIPATRIFVQPIKLDPPLLVLQPEGGCWLRLARVCYTDGIQVLDLQGRGALRCPFSKGLCLAVVEGIVQIDVGIRCRNPITEALCEDLLLLHLVLHHCHDLVGEMAFLLVCGLLLHLFLHVRYAIANHILGLHFYFLRHFDGHFQGVALSPPLMSFARDRYEYLLFLVSGRGLHRLVFLPDKLGHLIVLVWVSAVIIHLRFKLVWI